MGHFSALFNGLARSISSRKEICGRDYLGREAAKKMTKDAMKNGLMLRSHGVIDVDGSKNFASAFSKRGEKGVNQDYIFVWEGFGCQEDTLVCGLFDGHGSWGHYVAKKVGDLMPSSLLFNWQEAVAQTPLHTNPSLESQKKLQAFDVWESSCMKVCAAIDQELEQDCGIDSFHSGTTGLIVVKQGELIVVANIGDSRAVLASTSDDGNLVPVQLTVDLKPNLPQEAERITRCRGKVFCLEEEPGLHRVGRPGEETPALAMSRAFGDYCMKDFGVISEPEVTQWNVTNRDQFIVLATDGVWDVISNEEAVEIVSLVPDKAKSAKHLVKSAARAWKKRRRGIAMDDISAICVFFNAPSSSLQQFCSSAGKLQQ